MGRLPSPETVVRQQRSTIKHLRAAISDYEQRELHAVSITRQLMSQLAHAERRIDALLKLEST